MREKAVKFTDFPLFRCMISEQRVAPGELELNTGGPNNEQRLQSPMKCVTPPFSKTLRHFLSPSIHLSAVNKKLSCRGDTAGRL